MSIDTQHIKTSKQSVKVFADFSACNFHIPCNYLMLISEISGKIPVFSYLLLEAAASQEIESIVNLTECADHFHIVEPYEINSPNYEPDVNVIISDAYRELLFQRSVKYHIIIEKSNFNYNGEKRNIKDMMQFLRGLFTECPSGK
jgi:hypothetical protein